MDFHSLIDQLNEFFERERDLQKPPLLLRQGKIEGRFGHLRLATIFHSIRRVDLPERIIGQQAYLRIFADGEYPLPVLDAFSSEHDTFSVINLDRLCRTLHVLNFLLYPQTGTDLFLHVNPRHVTGLKVNHGAYFEEILGYCGLTTQQLVITLALGFHSGSAYPSFIKGLDNYRKRGFRVAIKFNQRISLEKNVVRFLQELHPDFLHLHGSLIQSSHCTDQEIDSSQLCFNPLIEAGREVGAQIVAECLETEQQMALAVAAGADLVQGYLFDGASV
jgi:EAL domain-containing protein (putative c-di-GMP-specific phosphodiesterase class I)